MSDDFIDFELDQLPYSPERERYRRYLNAEAARGARKVVISMIEQGMLPPEAIDDWPEPPVTDTAEEIVDPFPPETRARFTKMWNDLLNGALPTYPEG